MLPLLQVSGLQGTLQSVGRAISQKTDPGLVAMTGVFNAMNQIEAPEFLPDMPGRTRAVVQPGVGGVYQPVTVHMRKAASAMYLRAALCAGACGVAAAAEHGVADGVGGAAAV